MYFISPDPERKSEPYSGEFEKTWNILETITIGKVLIYVITFFYDSSNSNFTKTSLRFQVRFGSNLIRHFRIQLTSGQVIISIFRFKSG